MNLGDLRTEVLNRGFDPTVYGARITNWLNDGQNLIARRVNFELASATNSYTTVPGTDTYALPTDFGRLREVFDTEIPYRLEQVGLTDIDRATIVQSRPTVYAMDGTSIRVYPIPDGIYSLEMRYWKMPVQMVADTDLPEDIPTDWHQLLVWYATWMCYEADDDAAMGQYWQGRFTNMLAEFAADQRFPSTDYPTRLADMWSSGDELLASGNSWTLYAGW